MEKLTILLVDDHQLVRDSWSYILNSDPRFRVVGSTSIADDAINIAKTKHPRIVLMDLNMTPVSGFDLTKMMRREVPDSRIIAVSMHNMPAYARRIIQMGAMGYITKNSSKEEMMNAIVTVAKGDKYVCDEIKTILTQQELTDDEPKMVDMSALTQRERGVVQMIKEGLSSRQIGEKLDLSLKTVEVHRYNILRKLKLKNTAMLVNYINTQGL